MNEAHEEILVPKSDNTINYKALLQQSFLTLKDMRAQLEAAENEKSEPIAILGIGCRFPHGAIDPDSFWRLLYRGEDAISEVPPMRWNIDDYYDPDPSVPGKMATRWGGFLPDVDQFDAAFFGISPREAMHMDPQQRLALEVAWEALEHAGLPIDTLKGSQTGVFVGASSGDYSLLENSDPSRVNAYVASGTSHSVIAGRISYLLDLRGPSVVLDTACSSSLVAVHQAAQSLRNRECSLAIAGGVNLILSPLSTLSLSHWGMMAADGRCKTFDRRADGFVRGEGCGMVILKRLSAALAAGDPILAVVRGSAVNQDGRSAGLTAPNMQAQQDLLRQVLAQARLHPEQISVIEAHGTGTSLGDPIEVEALKAVFGKPRSPEAPEKCWLGSVKTNLGHTEAAAGIAGLIKVVLSLQHEQIPPHLHFESLNPNILLEDTPFAIPTAVHAWPRQPGQPRYAGVSSFGFSGTNAHIIVEEAPVVSDATEHEEPHDHSLFLLPFSARSPQALLALARRYESFLRDTRHALQAICATASTRRSHQPYRQVLLGHSKEDLLASLQAFLHQQDAAHDQVGEASSVFARQAVKTVFVFPGQGSQWLGMGRELWQQEPVFRQALHDCEQAMTPYLAWSLTQQLHTDEPLQDIDVVQPLLFALHVALARLWMSWGILPAAVMGHSMGEVAAAHIAGLLSLSDAARIICRRSQLLRRLRGTGRMALLEADRSQAQEWIAQDHTRLSIAACNGPRSTIVAGETSAIEALLIRLQAQGIFCRAVPVDVASHSPLVEPLRADLQAALQGITPQPGQFPMYSTVRGRWLQAQDLQASYWVDNLREPVQFWPGVQQVVGEGYNTLLEISPHPVLVTAMQEGVQQLQAEVLVLSSLKRQQPERATLLQGIARLYEQGASIDWQKLFPTREHSVPLPTYPWQHERFWLAASEQHTQNTQIVESGHTGISSMPTTYPLLGQRLHAPLRDILFEAQIGISTPTFLSEHKVSGKVIFPAAAYLMMALSSVSEGYGERLYTLTNTLFLAPLFLTVQQQHTIQLVLKPQEEATAGTAGTWQIFGLEAGTAEDSDSWQLYASGQWQHLATDSLSLETTEHPAYKELLTQSTLEMSGVEYYRRMQEVGFEYGPCFQGVQHLWLKNNEALGQIQLPASLTQETFSKYVHPAVLDACLQVFSAALLQQAAQMKDVLYLPAGIARIQVYRSFPDQIWSYVVLQKSEETIAETIKGSIYIFDHSSVLLAKIEAFTVRKAKSTFLRDNERKWLEPLLYQLQWHPQQNKEHIAALTPEQKGDWIIFADHGGLGQALALSLEQQGASCTIALLSSEETPEHIEEYVRMALGEQPAHYKGIIYLWNLDLLSFEASTTSDLLVSQHRAYGSLLSMVQTLIDIGQKNVPQLWVVTRGAQNVGDTNEGLVPSQAPIWGFGRSLIYEHPELHSVLIDLDPAGGEAEAKMLYTEIIMNESEGQVAYRNHLRYVARLERYHPETQKVKEDLAEFAGQPISLEITERGTLNNLVLRPAKRRLPAYGEVEIQIHATGLNFRDVLNVLGTYPGDPGALGSECAGRVVAIGEGVEHIHVNDRVVAALKSASFSSFITLPVVHVVRIPAQLSFAEAASIPTAFLTAYYGLHILGKMKAGDKVLIHSAAGGVGLAAVQMAQRAGASVYATVGSYKKREYLKSLGLQHIMDSRSLAFSQEIMQQTQGRGVDIVLNALTGEYIAQSLSVLAPGGRFIELGKAEIWTEKQLTQIKSDIAYLPLDMGQIFQEGPHMVQETLVTLLKQVEQGTLTALPYKVFPLENVESAFRYMAQSRHIGKIVVTQPDTARIFTDRLKEDGCYLITGGLGALGLVLARWMADRGARYLALMGRSEPSPEALETLRDLNERGIQTRIIQADVAQLEDLRTALTMLQQEMGPLHGVIHAAGILRDGVLMQQTWENTVSVLAPKMLGAWNLHQLTQELPLDFFVLFSSMASLLGSAGQSNYAAANAFMDTLAIYRRNQNLPATSINWGAWSGVGLATRDSIQSRMTTRGIHAISPEKGCIALEYILKQDIAHIGVSPIHWPTLAAIFQDGNVPGFLKGIIAEERELLPATEQRGTFLSQLEVAHSGQRIPLLTEHVRAQINKVLGLSPTYRIDVQQGLFEVGMDSLMAVEVKNMLSNSLHYTLPATLLFDYPTITALVQYIADEVFAWQRVEETPLLSAQQEEANKREDMLETLEELSDDQVESMLLEKLAHIHERNPR